MLERAYQIAEACITDTLESFEFHQKGSDGFQERMQPNDFLANILYFRICSYTEQIAVINSLSKLIEEQKDVKIVIIDSISFHFRQNFEDMAQRTRVLKGLSQTLMKLAKKYSLAVVLQNQVTTKRKDDVSFQLTLALGDTWSHSCTNRVILHWNGNDRHAYIEKSPSLPSASASFSVTSKGIGEEALQPNAGDQGSKTGAQHLSRREWRSPHESFQGFGTIEWANSCVL